MKNLIVRALALPLVLSVATAAAITLDETPAGDEEWGYHPAAGAAGLKRLGGGYLLEAELSDGSIVETVSSGGGSP